MKRLVCLLVCAFALTGRVFAAERTVCASGCQYTDLQAAIDAAAPGDVILLRAGETFVGHVWLRNKHTSSTAFITITSDADPSRVPAPGVRLVPEGRPGANVSLSALPRLLGRGGSWRNTPLVRAEPGAHHYRLQLLHLDGTANLGWGTLVAIGSDQTTNSAAPHTIVLDRLYLHGHPTRGMKRGIALNARAVDVLNSYISGFSSTADAQAIAGWNGAGPFRIVNNFLEGAAENILFGGADPDTPDLIPSDIEIRGNHFYKPLSWRNAILKTPSKPSVSARTGGSLSAGTHYFKVVAVMPIDGDTVVSAPSPEAAVTVSSGGAVALSWAAVTGAERYRVYRGTSSNGQNVYVETTSATTSLVYTGSGQTSGTPRSSGTRWTVKNHLELKNAQRVTIDGNLFENNWSGFQHGYSVLFTPKQGSRAPWSTVRDVTFTNNVVRHVAAGINISGHDYESVTQQGRNFRIANNLFFDVDSEYGPGMGQFLLIAGGPANIVVDHNTVVQDGEILEVEGPQIPGFVYTNNLTLHNKYGVKGRSRAVGTDTLDYFFPGWVFEGNVLAGGSASLYPPGNFFPSVAEFFASFVDPAGGNYSLVGGSPLNGAGTDGRDIGADMAQIAAAQNGDSEDAGEGEDPPEPPDGGGSVPGPLPQGWKWEDVGSAGPQGISSYAGGVFTVKGAGADIWGSADAFQFAYRELPGDGTVVARVASLAGDHPWAKAGVMIRASTAPGAVHAMMVVSKSQGLAFQRRTKEGGSSTHTSGGAGAAPRWVKLARAGNVVTASVSTDGQLWTVVGQDTIPLPATALVGLAVTSHDAGALGTGVFDHVTVDQASPLPPGWESADIGQVGAAGSVTVNGGTAVVRGAGADIWGSVDAFHFVSRTLAGNGEITARVAAFSASDPWAKAGVMIRQSLDAGAAHAFALVSAGNGVAFQRRTVAGGTTTHTSGGGGAAPRWLKVRREGSRVSAWVSTNGSSWTAIGTDTVSISGVVHIGLAVTSHDAGRLASATFDKVTVATW